jgi:hypothetical protein
MKSKHPCHNSRLRTGVVIATVENSADECVLDTFLAHTSVAEQISTGTQQTKILDGLDDGDTGILASVVGRGRDKGKDIVKMRDRRLLVTKKTAQRAMCVCSPERSRSEADFLQEGIVPNLIVVAEILKDLMMIADQETLFCLHHAVFAAALLIEVVCDENFHGEPPAARATTA